VSKYFLLFFCLLNWNSCVSWQPPPPEARQLEQFMAQHWPEYQELKVTFWPPSSDPRYAGLLSQIRFELPLKQTTVQARTALQQELQSKFAIWLEAQDHPEALCVSVELTEQAESLQVTLQIVCR